MTGTTKVLVGVGVVGGLLYYTRAQARAAANAPSCTDTAQCPTGTTCRDGKCLPRASGTVTRAGAGVTKATQSFLDWATGGTGWRTGASSGSFLDWATGGTGWRTGEGGAAGGWGDDEDGSGAGGATTPGDTWWDRWLAEWDGAPKKTDSVF